MLSAAKHPLYLIEKTQQQILRFAQDRSKWSERAQDDIREAFFSSLLG